MEYSMRGSECTLRLLRPSLIAWADSPPATAQERKLCELRTSGTVARRGSLCLHCHLLRTCEEPDGAASQAKGH